MLFCLFVFHESAIVLHFRVLSLSYRLKPLHVVFQCRQILKYTYAFGFYLSDGPEKELFEFLQQDLEKNTVSFVLNWTVLMLCDSSCGSARTVLCVRLFFLTTHCCNVSTITVCHQHINNVITLTQSTGTPTHRPSQQYFNAKRAVLYVVIAVGAAFPMLSRPADI